MTRTTTAKNPPPVRLGNVVRNANLVERDPVSAGIERVVGLEFSSHRALGRHKFTYGEGSSKVASLDEIREKGSNLSIPLHARRERKAEGRVVWRIFPGPTRPRGRGPGVAVMVAQGKRGPGAGRTLT